MSKQKKNFYLSRETIKKMDELIQIGFAKKPSELIEKIVMETYSRQTKKKISKQPEFKNLYNCNIGQWQKLEKNIQAKAIFLSKQYQISDLTEEMIQNALEFAIKYHKKWIPEKGSLWNYLQKGIIATMKKTINEELAQWKTLILQKSSE